MASNPPQRLAGSTDVVGFLGLGLFTAHITGNLAVLAVHAVVTGDRGPLASMLAIPVFMIALAFAKVLAGAAESPGIGARRILLLSQFLFLAGSAVLAIVAGSTILAGMLAVSAMAVQSAEGAPEAHGDARAANGRDDGQRDSLHARCRGDAPRA